MCTVSFIPAGDRVIISSNRDERMARRQALPPATYAMKTGNILFPKDANAGGTWFAVHENGNMIVFLNGAAAVHIPEPPYCKSRGLVLLDILDSDSPYEKFLTIDLDNIEPFTAVIFNSNMLAECRWNGQKKSYRLLPKDKPLIWSSVTLYDDQVIARRKSWFKAWLSKNPAPSQEDVLWFHQFTGDGDRHNDLLMNRDGVVFTVSITSLEISAEQARMRYLDFKDQQSYADKLIFSKAMITS